MLNAIGDFVLSKYSNESDAVYTKWMPIEEKLKYTNCQVAHKFSNDPQFPKYLKLKPKKDRRVLPNKNEQMELLIDFSDETGTFAKNAKSINNMLPNDIKKLINHSQFRNRAKRCFMALALTVFIALTYKYM